MANRVAKSKSRHHKKEAKQRRFAELEARQWRPFDRVFAAVGVPSLMPYLDVSIKRWLQEHRYPRPRVVLHPSAASHPATSQVQTEIERVLRQATLNSWTDLTVDDLFSAAMVMSQFLEHVQFVAGGRDPRINRAKPAFRELAEKGRREAIEVLLMQIDERLTHFSCLDRQLFWTKMGFKECHLGQVALEVELGLSGPERIDVEIDGKRRPAYRCGASDHGQGVEWVTWKASNLGWTGEKEYPVYVQSHAIDRVHQRVAIDAPHAVHDSIFISLRDPKIMAQSGDECLIEYRFFQKRLGYLVAQRLADVVVVKTFLFLTMQGTPEARLLRDRLRLKRPDIEFLHLDHLAAFVHTDLQHDPELVKMFEDCGCGHLLVLARPEYRAQVMRGYARGVRQYMNLPSTAN